MRGERLEARRGSGQEETGVQRLGLLRGARCAGCALVSLQLASRSGLSMAAAALVAALHAPLAVVAWLPSSTMSHGIFFIDLCEECESLCSCASCAAELGADATCDPRGDCGVETRASLNNASIVA